jgi:hypothetical protein
LPPDMTTISIRPAPARLFTNCTLAGLGPRTKSSPARLRQSPWEATTDPIRWRRRQPGRIVGEPAGQGGSGGTSRRTAACWWRRRLHGNPDCQAGDI